MKKTLFRWAGSMVAGLALSTPGFAQTEPVEAYIAAARSADPSALVRVLANAVYVDGDYGRDVAAADLPAYLAKQASPHLKLVDRKALAGHQVELSWSLGGGAADFTDTLTLTEGQLSRVVTAGVPAPPAEAAWVERFVAARRDSTDPVFRPLFVSSARIFGRSFPSEGATVDEYLEFLSYYSGTVYARLPDSVRRAKDGHLYYRFEVRNASGSALVGGTDHIYRQGELVSKLVGVY